jgi:spermidine synthase
VCTVAGALLIVVTVLITQTPLATRMVVAAVLALLPFLGTGLFLALVFMVEVARSRELYAADLLGAGIGCLVSLPALQWFGAENTLALAALSFLTLAAFLAITTDRRRWLLPTCTWLLLSGLLGLKMTAGLLTMQPTVFRHSHKHLGHILRQNPYAHIVDSRWSALARTDVVAFSQEGEWQYVALTDGGAATVLTPLPATPAAWNRWEHHAGLFPYRTSPRERVLIIGSGGGLDVILALHGGAQAITAVEINPDILAAAERFVPPGRNVYHAPGVEVVRGDGRLFVRQTTQRYDLIVLPLVYTGAAQWQGGAQAENYLLTTEAFEDYLAHLTAQGRLVIRIHDAEEMLKIVLMSVQALARRGITAAAALNHLLILQEAPDGQDTPVPLAPLVILRPTPYTLTESQQHVSMAHTMDLLPLFIPHVADASPLAGLLQRTQTHASLPMGRVVQPATDQRPFFYETDTNLMRSAWVVLAMVLVLLSMSLWYGTRRKHGKSAAWVSPAWLPFFALIGGAGLVTQIALLQRYLVVLGSPTLTLVVLLFPLLSLSGLGSLASTALSDRMLRWLLPWSCVVLGGLLLLSCAAFPWVRSWLETQYLLKRLLGFMLLLAPLGMLMGLPFPVALRLLSPMATSIMPWIWGMNAVACVLGSVLAVRFAVAWGLPAVHILGATLYLLAGGMAYGLLLQQQPSPARPA